MYRENKIDKFMQIFTKTKGKWECQIGNLCHSGAWCLAILPYSLPTILGILCDHKPVLWY